MAGCCSQVPCPLIWCFGLPITSITPSPPCCSSFAQALCRAWNALMHALNGNMAERTLLFINLGAWRSQTAWLEHALTTCDVLAAVETNLKYSQHRFATDLVKAYESVDFSQLEHALTCVGVPACLIRMMLQLYQGARRLSVSGFLSYPVIFFSWYSCWMPPCGFSLECCHCKSCSGACC